MYACVAVPDRDGHHVLITLLHLKHCTAELLLRVWLIPFLDAAETHNSARKYTTILNKCSVLQNMQHKTIDNCSTVD